MKWVLLLLCLLLAAPACAEELDEAALAQLVQETAPVSVLEETPEHVYADSDVENHDEAFEQRIDPGELPEYVHQLLAVAEKEIGYTESSGNRTKYGEWSGDPNAAWCAEFVCWCVDQVDQQHGTGLLKRIYPMYSGQNTGRDWFIARGRFIYRKGVCPNWGSQWLKGGDHNLKSGEYIPRPGDLVFFSYNEAGDTEHVALVEYCSYDSEGRVIIHVIEGNNPSKVQRNRYRLSNSQVLGFGLCEDIADTTIRYGCRGDKVKQLQEDLHFIGLLEERHLTGTMGSNTKRAVMDFQQKYLSGKSANGIADRETQQALAEVVYDVMYRTPETWLVE